MWCQRWHRNYTSFTWRGKKGVHKGVWGSDRLSPLCSIQGARPRLVSLMGKETQTLQCNCARICSRFAEEVLRILLAVLGMWLVPLRRASCVTPGCPCLCPSPGDSPRLCHCSSLSPQSLGLLELERCTNGTKDLTGLFGVLCCRSCPKTQHSSPSGAEDWSENTPALSQPCVSP